MATDQSSTWPMPKFRFVVDWGTQGKSSFQEILGIAAEPRNMEDSAKQYPANPGTKEYNRVTMKRGVFASDNNFTVWEKQIALNTAPTADVIVSLLDEEGQVTMRWKLKNAKATMLNASDLKSDGNEVAVESMELEHEGMSVM